jgi:hypothetical protein
MENKKSLNEYKTLPNLNDENLKQELAKYSPDDFIKRQYESLGRIKLIVDQMGGNKNEDYRNN